MNFDNIEILRFNSQRDYTIGCLSFIHSMRLYPITRKFQCFTLEDEYRTRKVRRETRIPAGKYELGLRTKGGLHQKYLKRFPKIHVGMIHILDVPNFKYICIHIGNDDKDTEGCPLVGDSIRKGRILDSASAYKRIYPVIAEKILKSPTYINVMDHDTPEVQ